MSKVEWLKCPVCESKTRIQLRYDTTLANFPLYCPKCKHETLVNVHQFNLNVIKEPIQKAESYAFGRYSVQIRVIILTTKADFQGHNAKFTYLIEGYIGI